MDRLKNYAAFGGYLLTIPAANWLIGHVGTTCVPDGPCLIPVAPGFMAPSGVLMVGVALVLRDVVHNQLGAKAALVAVMIGTLLSAVVAPPYLVLASALAFLLSELVDFGVYAPLRHRNLAAAVIASGIAGAVIDSAVFLWVAFGSLDYLAGQTLGKLYASALAVAFLYARRRLA